MSTVLPAQPFEATIAPPEALPVTITPPALVQFILSAPTAFNVALTPPTPTAISISNLPGAKGEPGNDLGRDYTAAVPVNAFHFVATESGSLVYASSANAAHVGRVLGLALNSADAGGAVRVANNLTVTNSGWNFQPNQPLFLGVSGELSANPYEGLFHQSAGFALTPTVVFINLGTPIVRT